MSTQLLLEQNAFSLLSASVCYYLSVLLYFTYCFRASGRTSGL